MNPSTLSQTDPTKQPTWDFNQQAELTTQLAEWYWQYGRLRQKEYALPLAGWLDPLERVRRVAETAGRVSSRPCMAVWGPSAAGKSTLLSNYLDSGADAQGNGSPLHWPGGKPVRFVVTDKTDNAVALNPYNLGVDASSPNISLKKVATEVSAQYLFG